MIDTIPCMIIRNDSLWFRRLSCTHIREIHGFHQAVHSTAADAYAMITSETYCHFICAEPLIGFRIDVQNSFSDICVFDLAVRFLMIQKLVLDLFDNPTSAYQIGGVSRQFD